MTRGPETVPDVSNLARGSVSLAAAIGVLTDCTSGPSSGQDENLFLLTPTALEAVSMCPTWGLGRGNLAATTTYCVN